MAFAVVSVFVNVEMVMDPVSRLKFTVEPAP